MPPPLKKLTVGAGAAGWKAGASCGENMSAEKHTGVIVVGSMKYGGQIVDETIG
jgi:hypothetical protein